MPVDATDLAALSDLAARGPGDRPAGPRAPHPASTGTGPRARVVGLAVLSVLAGLVCGLLAPSASAQAPTAAGATTAGGAARPLATVLPALASPSSVSFASRAPVARPSSRPGARGHGTLAARPAHGRIAGVVALGGTAVPSSAGSAPSAAAASAPARPVAARPLPAGSGTGRRIVYQQRTGHLWIVGADGAVLRDYPVTGRIGRPKAGTYHVFSKSPTSVNPIAKVRFDLMVRFAHGLTGAPIGFHTIPRWFDGRPLQSVQQLGDMIGAGGCVRQSQADAEWLYAWSRVGDTVVVLR